MAITASEARKNVFIVETNSLFSNPANAGRLHEETRLDPFSGVGKPERRKRERTWSRRINLEHRLGYEVVGDDLVIHQARLHDG